MRRWRFQTPLCIDDRKHKRVKWYETEMADTIVSFSLFLLFFDRNSNLSLSNLYE